MIVLLTAQFDAGFADCLMLKDGAVQTIKVHGRAFEPQASFQSLSDPPGSTDSSSISLSSRLSFDDLRTFVSQLQEKLQPAFEEEKENLCRIVRYIEVIPTPEYESRNEFLQYYQWFTLDSNSAHRYLRLSELDRVVTNIKKGQRHPNHPDRFTHLCQVLCRESVCGRCYWEVEWSGEVEISVSYGGMERELTVSLDVMISPGICHAMTPVSHSGIITNRLNSLQSPDPLE